MKNPQSAELVMGPSPLRMRCYVLHTDRGADLISYRDLFTLMETPTVIMKIAVNDSYSPGGVEAPFPIPCYSCRSKRFVE